MRIVPRVEELAAREAEVCAILEAPRTVEWRSRAPAGLPRR